MVQGSHSGHHITFSQPVYLGSSWLWQFLRPVLLLVTLTVWWVRYFEKCSLIGICLIFFKIRLKLCFLKRNTTEVKVPFSSHHEMMLYYHNDSPLLTITLTTWLKECLSSFFTVKLPSFPPFPIPHPSKRSLSKQPTKWGVRLLLLEDWVFI